MALVAVSSVPVSGWSANWAWGLPLIVGTVLFHVVGLGLIRQRTKRFSARSIQRFHPTATFVIVIAGATLLATSLHAIEAGIWAVAYLGLRALPDFKSAMLFSLDAITSYGHVNLNLEQHWHLMGSLEALNGWRCFSGSRLLFCSACSMKFGGRTKADDLCDRLLAAAIKFFGKEKSDNWRDI